MANLKLMSLGIFFLLFLLGRVQGKDDVSEEKEFDEGPYLDAEGNLCQDHMETVQDTEYETMIQCHVAMTKSCEDNTVEDIKPEKEACHTVYEKECKSVYRPQKSKVRVRICPDGIVDRAKSPFGSKYQSENENSIALDIRPNPRLTSPQIKKQCHKGKRMVCNTKYQTECTTQQIQQTMEEDHPKCQVEMVEKCPEKTNSRKTECRKVPAMRCRIEKRTVVKTKPESKCSRIPRQICRKEDCEVEDDKKELLKGDPNCYYRNQVVNEIVPQEKCSIIPKTMCHTVNTTADINSQSNRVLRTRRSAANDHWAFLRRHYLSRSTKSQVERMSRKVAERKLTKNSVVCKMVPEQKCERKRVNPRRVEKKMRKTHCREPKKNSIFDQMMVAKLTTRNP